MEGLAIDLKTDSTYKPQLLWTNIILMAFLHFIAIYFLLLYTFEPRLYTWMWFFFIKDLGGFGVTGGAHRLWSHRSYKAKWPLRIILLLCFTVTAQNSLYDWVRNHRVHHKFSETDADPHNSKRGFFFAHVGWLLQKKHPEVIKKGKSVDMSDLLQDPIVAFHQKHFPIFLILLSVVIPIAVPYFLWNETFLISLLCCGFLRYVLSLNYTWLVNSAAHIWGSKPYNANIKATQNLAVSIVALGEGWHNYHHTFPWDYKADEFGDYKFNVTTFWLDLFAKIGWAYDLKQPSKELVHKVAEKYGDGSRHHVNCPSPHEIDENGKATNCCQLEDEETENDSVKNID